MNNQERLAELIGKEGYTQTLVRCSECGIAPPLNECCLVPDADCPTKRDSPLPISELIEIAEKRLRGDGEGNMIIDAKSVYFSWEGWGKTHEYFRVEVERPTEPEARTACAIEALEKMKDA